MIPTSMPRHELLAALLRDPNLDAEDRAFFRRALTATSRRAPAARPPVALAATS